MSKNINETILTEDLNTVTGGKQDESGADKTGGLTTRYTGNNEVPKVGGLAARYLDRHRD